MDTVAFADSDAGAELGESLGGYLPRLAKRFDTCGNLTVDGADRLEPRPLSRPVDDSFRLLPILALEIPVTANRKSPPWRGYSY